MFARSTFRAAQQPLKCQYRRYATEPPKSSSNAAIYSAALAVLAGGGYYFYNQGDNSQKVADAADKARTIADKAEKAGEKGDTTNAKSAFLGGDQGFISLKLDSVENVNHNTKKLRFTLPEKDQVSGLHVASALLTKYKGPGMEKPVIRPYTPISDESDPGFLDLLVKKYPNGPMSTHLHDMEPNQRLDFKGPIPKYPWTENKHNHIALVAGGTGITPMYQLTRAIFNNPNDKTKVTLVFGNVSEEDILLKREFEHLENTYPQRFRAFYALEKPTENSPMAPKRITSELLKTVLPDPKSENIKIFVCGPPGMYKAISGPKTSPSDQGELDGALKELGYSKEQVYKF